ncbi:hypothetical protein, partial [Aliarcobacter butzleri]|uniref:hypothetical protein n=1 Tax=Aliarcobacter butzleri TaxID=28197 RepID=UPI00263DC89D
TVKAGDLTGTTTLNYSDSDVFVDPTTIPAPEGLTTTNNSNYEDLKPVNSATKYDVADSKDPSTVTLTSVGSGDEDGATVTYTATFTTAPTQDETVSFKVNTVDYRISLKAGNLTGTTR